MLWLIGEYEIVFLVQWFGLISHSPRESIDCKADFMCEGISTLLKHKENIDEWLSFLQSDVVSATSLCKNLPNKKKISHLCFWLSVNSNHVLSAGRSHKGAGLLVLLH